MDKRISIYADDARQAIPTGDRSLDERGHHSPGRHENEPFRGNRAGAEVQDRAMLVLGETFALNA